MLCLFFFDFTFSGAKQRCRMQDAKCNRQRSHQECVVCFVCRARLANCQLVSQTVSQEVRQSKKPFRLVCASVAPLVALDKQNSKICDDDDEAVEGDKNGLI